MLWKKCKNPQERANKIQKRHQSNRNALSKYIYKINDIEFKWLDVNANNFVDFKKIDSEISELRLKFGAGYRIYYTEIEEIIVLLINGGDKSTQSKDIEKARKILQEWRNLQ